jgi:septal ring factor EnvC (AmiA/AmiB activator)
MINDLTKKVCNNNQFYHQKQNYGICEIENYEIYKSIDSKIEEKQRLLQEEKEVFVSLWLKRESISKRIEDINEQIKETDIASKPGGSYAASVAGHYNPVWYHAAECSWRVSPNQYSDEACKRKISEKKHNIAKLEDELNKIIQNIDLLFERVTKLTVEQSTLEKQLKALDQVDMKIEEEEVAQEDISFPGFVVEVKI